MTNKKNVETKYEGHHKKVSLFLYINNQNKTNIIKKRKMSKQKLRLLSDLKIKQNTKRRLKKA